MEKLALGKCDGWGHKDASLRQQAWAAWRSSAQCSIAQLCPTLCDPMDCSPLGSSIHGISQAKKQEWVAISFSTRMRKCSFNVLKLPFICRIALLESKWHSWQTSVCFYYIHRMINRWHTVFLIWDTGADVSKWPSVLWLLNPFFIQILPSL